jgi:hypothetical protein
MVANKKGNKGILGSGAHGFEGKIALSVCIQFCLFVDRVKDYSYTCKYK